MITEPITLGGGERPNAGSAQEKTGLPSVRSALVGIPALSRTGLDWMAFEVPFMAPGFYDETEVFKKHQHPPRKKSNWASI